MSVKEQLANAGLLMPLVALIAWFLGWDHLRWFAFAFLLLYPVAKWSEMQDQLSTLKQQVRALEEQNRALRQELVDAHITPPSVD